jgi:hypothetical protein
MPDNPTGLPEQSRMAYAWLSDLLRIGPTLGHLCECGCRKGSHGPLGCEHCNVCANTFPLGRP